MDLQASPLINFSVKEKEFLLVSPTGNVFSVLLSDQDKAVGVETAQSLHRYLFPCAAALGELNSRTWLDEPGLPGFLVVRFVAPGSVG